MNTKKPASETALQLPLDRNELRNQLVPLFNEQVRTLQHLFEQQVRAQEEALVAVALALANCAGRAEFAKALKATITSTPDDWSANTARLLAAMLRALPPD